eukprot:Skav224849  [mRNA]  locus=scaffold322:19071:21071:+ [translate_table: standard]
MGMAKLKSSIRMPGWSALMLFLFPTGGAYSPVSQVLNKLETANVVRTPTVPSFFNSSGWVSPVPNRSAISSPFGPRWKISSDRFDFHRGIDYFDADGTELYAIADGVVFDHRNFVDGGTTTIIEHVLDNPTGAMFHDRQINKVFAYYNHLQERFTSEGQIVQKGQVIGTMGQTGTTTFTHLHFTTRLVGYCTLQYQVENNRVPTASSQCATGFDPAVHPYLFVGADPRVGLKELYEISPKNDSFVFSARYTTGRGHLDLDVIETDFGRVSFNTREGVWGKNTIEGLDDLDNLTSWMALNPGIFRSTTLDEIYYDMHFYVKPAYLEVLDIYGDGIRWEVDDSQSSTSATEVSSSGQASSRDDDLIRASRKTRWSSSGCYQLAMAKMAMGP